MVEPFDGENCTACGKPLRFAGASIIEGICLKCVYGGEDVKE